MFFFLILTSFNKAISPLIQNGNNYGDSGPICLNLLIGIIRPLGSSFISTEKVANFTHFMIGFISLESNPIFNITISKKSHSTLSYALLISRFTNIKHLFLPSCFLRSGSIHKLPTHCQ